MTIAIPNPTSVHRCTKHPDKVQHRTSAAAFEARDRAQARTDHPLYVYVCDHCGYFHLSKKRGTEAIGRLVASVKDGVVWESRVEAPEPPPRDPRFVPSLPGQVTEAALIDAIRGHGNPAEVTPAQLRAWTDMTPTRIRGGMRRLGWTSVGNTKSAVWVRMAPSSPETPSQPVAVLKQPNQASTPSEAPTAPLSAVPERKPSPVRSLPKPAAGENAGTKVPVASLGSITISDLVAAWHALGYDLEVRAVPVARRARAQG